MANDKDAWIKFFPTDWRGDTNLQLCSIAARGLWIEMIAIMHTCDPYGHLTQNGAPMPVNVLAFLIRVDLSECQLLLEQLEKANVFSRTKEGIIFSRRMLRDRHLRNVRSESGRQGGLSSLGSRLAQANMQSKTSRARGRALASGFLASGSMDLDSFLPEGVQGKPSGGNGTPKESTGWIRDLWNTKTPETLPRCKVWTSKRHRGAMARLTEYPNPADWETAIASISSSRFLTGQNDRRWRASIDWILERPNALAGLLEGKYADNARRSIAGEGDLPW
jgi:hypothetical protein